MLRRLLAMAGVGVLVACGGGGSDPPAPAQPTLGNLRASGTAQEVFSDDELLQAFVIRADVTGDLSQLGSLFVIVEDPDGLFAPNPVLQVSANGIDNVLTLQPRSVAGRLGTFTGPLRVNVCSDAACRTPLRGSPLLVPYAVKLLPGLSLERSGTALLAADFGSVPAPWSSGVALPAGATTFDAELVRFGLVTSAELLSLDKGTASVTLTPRLGPVAEHRYELRVSATGRTSTGRERRFTRSVGVAYDVRSTGVPVIFSADPLEITIPAGGSSGFVRFEALLAVDDEIETFQSIDYLGAPPWLETRAVDVPGHMGAIEFLARGCYTTLPPPGAPPCLLPGRHGAVVTLRTRTGSLLTRTLQVNLTVTP